MLYHYVMQLLTKNERNRFAVLAAEAVPQALPMLEAGVPQGPFSSDTLNFWTQYPRGDKRRWGVTLMRLAAKGPDSNTTLSITVPSTPVMPR